MIARFKRSSIAAQLLLLAALTALAFGVSLLVDFQPRLRASSGMVMRGAVGGVAVFLLLAFLHAVAGLIFPKRYRAELREMSALHPGTGPRRLSNPTIIGAGLVAAAGEELLLRGFVFSWLLKFNVVLAFIAHFFLVFLLYFESRSRLIWGIFAGIEGSLYAAMYSYNRSLLMVAIAHGIVQILSLFVLRDFNEKLGELTALNLRRFKGIKSSSA